MSVVSVVARVCRWRRMLRPVARPERWMMSVLVMMGGSWMRDDDDDEVEEEEEEERWRLRRERLV